MSEVALAPVASSSASASSRTLRVGVLVDALEQPAWVRRAVEEVGGSSHSAIVAVFVAARDATAREKIAPRARWKYLLVDAYERFDRRWFSDGRLDAFEPTTIAPLVEGVRIEVASTSAASGELDAATASAIRDYDLDVLLAFGADRIRLPAAPLARHGVWSIDGRGGSERRPLGGLWEVLRGSPVTESALVVEPANDQPPRTIYRSLGSTWSVSVWKTRRERFWKAASFMVRKLRDLAEQGPSAIAPVGGPAPAGRADGATPAPTNAQVLARLPGVGARYAKLQVDRRISFDQWFVAYHFARDESRGTGVPDTAFADFTHLLPPRDRLWADPFPVLHRGQHYLFVEELLYARNKGHISVIEFENDRALRPELVLETPHHLSYPYILPWRGEMFLVPESARSGDSPAERAQLSIPVFRARKFPGDWVQETAMLEDLEVFDPTLAEIDGRWWLFCARGELGASSWDELHLFHAPTPFGPWTPHRGNPVKSDVRSARPAGRLYQRDGEWYRPAQDCSVRYGYGMSINRITRLTPTEYEEVVVEHIAPTWSRHLKGTHTLNAAGRLTVVDGIRRRSRWSRDGDPFRR
jgi:hypothetical protein